MSDDVLFTLVRDRPIPERPSAAPTCPVCGSDDIHVRNRMRTLIGGGDGTRDGDPNHWHEESACRTCGAEFMRETKSGNTWYTGPAGRVLKGMPSCFEQYAYTCGACGGAVERHYTQMDGETPAYSLSTTIGTDGPQRHYRIFFQCEECHKSVEYDRDYWHP